MRESKVRSIDQVRDIRPDTRVEGRRRKMWITVHKEEGAHWYKRDLYTLAVIFGHSLGRQRSPARLGRGRQMREPSRENPKTTYVFASDLPSALIRNSGNWETYTTRNADKYQEDRKSAFSCLAPQEVFFSVWWALKRKKQEKRTVGAGREQRRE